MARRLATLCLTDEEWTELKALASRRKTAQALALRARIILACAEGGENKEVAAKLGVVEMTVGKWRRRFVQDRVEGLRDEPRPGAPRTINDARIEATIVKTLESLPKDATHWSSRGMAKESGLCALCGTWPAWMCQAAFAITSGGVCTCAFSALARYSSVAFGITSK